MTLDEYNELKRIAHFVASRKAIRLTQEQLHDVATTIWEGESIFQSRNPNATPEHLRNFRFLKASGAVIEQVWFSTWATKGKAPMKLAPVTSLMHHIISDDRATTFEMAQALRSSKDGDLVIEYITGSNMKEIAAKRGISESAISQRLTAFQLVSEEGMI